MQKIPDFPYAFTATLRPLMYKHKPITQFKRSCAALNRVIEDNDLVFDYLFPEVTAANNVHYHGVILLDHKSWLHANDYVQELFRNNEQIGYICLKEMKDSGKWLEYCSKQAEFVQDKFYSKTFWRPLTIERIREAERQRNLAQDIFNSIVDAVEEPMSLTTRCHNGECECERCSQEQTRPVDASPEGSNRAGEGKVNTQPGEA